MSTRATQETDQRIREEVRDVSRRLVDANLLEYFGGNLSVRIDSERMLVTRGHANKAVPTDHDLVVTGIWQDDDNTPAASSALEIHRAIYQRTAAAAIVHAHPRMTVTLSFFMESIEPIDENGKMYLGFKPVPVIAAPLLAGWNLTADAIGNASSDEGIVVGRWHGTYATGRDLAHAYHLTRALEFASEKIINVALLTPHLGTPALPPEELAPVLGGVERSWRRRLP